MNTAELLSRDEGRAILRRAARAAGMAVAAHRYADGAERDTVAGCGTCAAACAYVAGLPWGPQACRRSREKAAATARVRNRPVAHLCHMGFALVTSPMIAGNQDLLLTFGPFCPAETPDALDRDASDGLARLDPQAAGDPDALPFTLDDIPRVAADSVPALAEWTCETFTKHACDTRNDTVSVHDGKDDPVAPHRRRAPRRVVRDPYRAHAVFAALAARDARRARTLVDETVFGSASDARIAGLAIAAAVLDVARAAGAAEADAVHRMARLATAIADAESPRAVRTAVLKTLRSAVRSAPGNRDTGDAADFFARVDELLRADLTACPSLTELSDRLGISASTITRRLQRRYGLTYSGYVARLRVDRAKRLLVATRLSVDAVAHRVGLNDGSHLRKLMRQFEGRTPGSFRSKPAR